VSEEDLERSRIQRWWNRQEWTFQFAYVGLVLLVFWVAYQVVLGPSDRELERLAQKDLPTAESRATEDVSLTVLERAEAHAVVSERMPDNGRPTWGGEYVKIVNGRKILCGTVTWVTAGGSQLPSRRFVAFRNSASIEGQPYFADDWRLNCS
jgi:hypothetical protein